MSGQLKTPGGFLPESFPVAAKMYILSVIAVGLSVFLYSAYLSWTHPDSRWLYLAGLTVVASCLVVKIPLIKGNTSLSITISDVFIFAAILVFGPAVAVVMAVIEGFITNFRVGNKVLTLVPSLRDRSLTRADSHPDGNCELAPGSARVSRASS